MSEMKFKVGDKVIANGFPAGCGLGQPVKNAIGTVVEVCNHESKAYYILILDDRLLQYWDRWAWNEKTLEQCPDYTTRDSIVKVCEEIKSLLLEKNESYGDSAINPIRIFSKADPEDQILTRIDDKLSRIARGKEYQTDDTLLDLIGYLVLLKVNRKIHNK